MNAASLSLLLVSMVVVAEERSSTAADIHRVTPRRPASDSDLRAWLENMVWYHQFRDDEIAAITGLTKPEIAAALQRFDLRAESRPTRPADAPLLVLPYPGGRHPRIGFLDGAIDPRRETKVSVFLPWDPTSYVVVDAPEAIWSNIGLLYLAHTHVPTIWDKRGIELEPLEWKRTEDGAFQIERRLPNGVEFGVHLRPEKEVVRLELWLRNGSDRPLSDLRVQNCVMLKGAKGFEQQTNDNKVLAAPYAACRNTAGDRWIITAWDPCHRPWANPPCPCIHSDPKFPDCLPGKTVRVQGILRFYEGKDLEGELKRLDKLRWRL